MFSKFFKKTKKEQPRQTVQYSFEQMMDSLENRMEALQKEAMNKIQEIDNLFNVLQEDFKKGEKNLKLDNPAYFFPESIEKLNWEKLDAHITKIIYDLKNTLNIFLEAFAHIKAVKIRYDNDLTIFEYEKIYSLKKIKSTQEKIETKKMRKQEGLEFIRSMEKRVLIAEKEVEILKEQCEDIQLHYKFCDKIVSTLKKHERILKMKQTLLRYEHQLNQLTIKHFQDFANQDASLKTTDAFLALEKQIEVEKQEIEKLRKEVLESLQK